MDAATAQPAAPGDAIPSSAPAPVDFPTNPPHLLLRIHCSSDLMGGWISLKAEGSLLVVHLLNFLLLEHIIKKRHVNLLGLNHEEIQIERNLQFERTSQLSSNESAEEEVTAENAESNWMMVDEETAVGDVWLQQIENLRTNKSYTLNPELPVCYLFLQSNSMFGELVGKTHFYFPVIGATPTNQYLEASGKHALNLSIAPTPSAVWSIYHTDNFELETDEVSVQGSVRPVSAMPSTQPVIYIRDAFHRFLSVAEKAPVAAEEKKENSMSLLEGEDEPMKAPTVRPPTAAGTLLLSSAHHDDTSKWVLEAFNASDSTPPQRADCFVLRNFNLLGGTAAQPSYLYFGLVKNTVNGKIVNQPALVPRKDAIKIDLLPEPMSGFLDKRTSGGNFLTRFFVSSSHKFGYYAEENDGFNPRLPADVAKAGTMKRVYNLNPSQSDCVYSKAIVDPKDNTLVILKRKDGKDQLDLHLKADTKLEAQQWVYVINMELKRDYPIFPSSYTLHTPPPALHFMQARLLYEQAQREAEMEEMRRRRAEEEEHEDEIIDEDELELRKIKKKPEEKQTASTPASTASGASPAFGANIIVTVTPPTPLQTTSTLEEKKNEEEEPGKKEAASVLFTPFIPESAKPASPAQKTGPTEESAPASSSSPSAPSSPPKQAQHAEPTSLHTTPRPYSTSTGSSKNAFSPTSPPLLGDPMFEGFEPAPEVAEAPARRFYSDDDSDSDDDERFMHRPKFVIKPKNPSSMPQPQSATATAAAPTATSPISKSTKAPVEAPQDDFEAAMQELDGEMESVNEPYHQMKTVGEASSSAATKSNATPLNTADDNFEEEEKYSSTVQTSNPPATLSPAASAPIAVVDDSQPMTVFKPSKPVEAIAEPAASTTADAEAPGETSAAPATKSMPSEAGEAKSMAPPSASEGESVAVMKGVSDDHAASSTGNVQPDDSSSSSSASSAPKHMLKVSTSEQPGAALSSSSTTVSAGTTPNASKTTPTPKTLQEYAWGDGKPIDPTKMKVITPSIQAFNPDYTIVDPNRVVPPKSVEPVVTKVEVVRTVTTEEEKEEGKKITTTVISGSDAPINSSSSSVAVVPPSPLQSTTQTQTDLVTQDKVLIPRVKVVLEPVSSFFDDSDDNDATIEWEEKRRADTFDPSASKPPAFMRVGAASASTAKEYPGGKVLVPTIFKVQEKMKLALEEYHATNNTLSNNGNDGALTVAALDTSMTDSDPLGLKKALTMEELEQKWKAESLDPSASRFASSSSAAPKPQSFSASAVFTPSPAPVNYYTPGIYSSPVSLLHPSSIPSLPHLPSVAAPSHPAELTPFTSSAHFDGSRSATASSTYPAHFTASSPFFAQSQSQTPNFSLRSPAPNNGAAASALLSPSSRPVTNTPYVSAYAQPNPPVLSSLTFPSPLPSAPTQSYSNSSPLPLTFAGSPSTSHYSSNNNNNFIPPFSPVSRLLIGSPLAASFSATASVPATSIPLNTGMATSLPPVTPKSTAPVAQPSPLPPTLYSPAYTAVSSAASPPENNGANSSSSSNNVAASPTGTRLFFGASTSNSTNPSAHIDSQLEALAKQLAQFKEKQKQLQEQLLSDSNAAETPGA